MCMGIRSAATRERNCFALSLPPFVIIFHGSFTIFSFTSSTGDTKNLGVLQGANILQAQATQDQLHNFQGLVQNENVRSLYKNYRECRDGDSRPLNQTQGPFESTHLCVTAQVTHPETGPESTNPPNLSSPMSQDSRTASNS